MAAPTAEAYADIVDRLYTAAHQPEQWTATMDAVRQLFDGSRACLMIADTTHGYHALPSQEDDWSDLTQSRDLAQTDSLFQAWFRVQPGRAVQYGEMMDVAAWRRTDLARNHFRPRDMDNGLVGMVRSGPMLRWSLDVSRARWQPDFSEAERAMAHRLMPHVLRAMQLANTFQPSPAEPGSDLGNAYFVVDGRGKLVDMNQAAEALLAQPNPVLRGTGGFLRAAVDGPGRLAALTAACCLPFDHPGSSPGGMVILAASEEAPLEARLLVSVTPLPSRGRFKIVRQACALLMVRPLYTGSQAVVAELAASLFGLTGSQARLAGALSGGISLQQAATMLGLGYNTARRYLEEIFRKTATRRQPELVALLKTIEASHAALGL